MQNYERKSFKFYCKRLNVAKPVDLLESGEYPVLRNVRVLRDGQIDTRGGLVKIGTLVGSGALSTVVRLNSDVDSTWVRLIAAGHRLFGGQTVFGVIDTDYSGNPLSMVAFRPNQSATPWMYIGDVNKLRKMRTDMVPYKVGIAPPVDAPISSLGVPAFTIINDFDSLTYTAVNVDTLTRLDRFITTIDIIRYDVGNFGWCSIIPADFNTNWQPGATMQIGGTENTRINQVFKAIVNTTIASITYDSGTTGMCSIVLTAPTANLYPNALVGVAAGGEWVRVLAVVQGKNGITSFRCVCTSNHVATDAIIGVNSFRVYTNLTFAHANAITGNAMSAIFRTGTGTLTKTITIDLSTVNGRPVLPDDYFHISLMVDTPQNIVEGRVALDVGDGTFTGNFYYKVFRASDLTPNVQGYLTYTTTQQVTTQREIIDDQGVVTYEDIVENVTTGIFVSGNSQWTELKFKLADMIRVGSDRSTSLATVASMRIQMQVSAATMMLMDSWWVGGGYGPDIGLQGSPFLYATRFRSSMTGARSNPSPVTRTGIMAYREQVTVNLPTSTDPQVNKVDVFRFGGGLDKFKLVGTYANGTAQAVDEFGSVVLETAELLAFDNYQPFPVVDLPRTGTCNTTGTLVTRVTGDAFNPAWTPGSQIVIGGLAYTLYKFPVGNLLELVESALAQTGVDFYLSQPLIAGMPLPVIWTFGGQGMGTFLMGVGDPYNPGYLRWCKGNDPDSAADSGNLEITSPSEPLMNGREYDGRCFVGSTERWFSVFLNTSGVGNQFTAQVVVSNNGLYARYGVQVTPYGLCWIGRDGIYLWTGGKPESLTDETLYPLFPHEGVAGQASNGYLPPDYDNPDDLRLSYADNALWFLYPDTGGTQRSLRYDFARKGWFPLDFTPAATVVALEEGKGLNAVLVGTGGDNGGLYTMAGVDDDGVLIECEVLTGSQDMGDSRTRKVFGDYMLDSQGVIGSQPGYDNNTVLADKIGFGQAIRGQNATGLGGQQARNMCLDLTWRGQGTVYEWQPSYLNKPEIGASRATDWDNCGQEGAKFIQGVRLRAAGSVSVPIEYYNDNGTLISGPVLAVNQGTEMVIPYSFTPFIAHLVRFGAVTWQYFGAEWIWEQVPEAATLWQTQETTHDLSGYQHIRRVLVAAIANADVVMTITVDGVAHAYTIPWNNGFYMKIPVATGILKGLYFQYTFTSALPFRLFLRDCELHVKPWGDAGYFHTVNPFGDISRVTGARI